MTQQEQDNRIIFYTFAVRAKGILKSLQTIDFNNMDLFELIELQAKAIKALEDYDREIIAYLRKYPDEKG